MRTPDTDGYLFVFPGADDARVAVHGLDQALAGLGPAPELSAEVKALTVLVRLRWPAGATDQDRGVAEKLLSDWAGSSGGRLV